MGYLRQVCSHWLSVITQVTGKNKRPEEPSAIEEPSESPSWLVLNLFKPKAIELNKDQPEPSLILTRNCSPQPAFNFKCFKTFGTSPVVRIWHSYIKKKKRKRTHLVFWTLFFCIREWGGRIDWTIQGRRAVSSGLQLATFPKNSHLSIAAEFLKHTTYVPHWYPQPQNHWLVWCLFHLPVWIRHLKTFNSRMAYAPRKLSRVFISISHSLAVGKKAELVYFQLARSQPSLQPHFPKQTSLSEALPIFFLGPGLRERRDQSAQRTATIGSTCCTPLPVPTGAEVAAVWRAQPDHATTQLPMYRKIPRLGMVEPGQHRIQERFMWLG